MTHVFFMAALGAALIVVGFPNGIEILRPTPVEHLKSSSGENRSCALQEVVRLVHFEPQQLDAGALGPAATAKTDFTGTWVLDTSRTEGLPEGIEQTMTVNQTGDRIEIETHSRSPMGERGAPDVYILDGKETDFQPVFIVEVSATNARRTSRWLESGNGFEATEHATIQGPDGQEGEMSVVRTWTLAPDGNTLTIEMKISGPPGEMTTTRVFTRQVPAAG